MLGLMMTSMKQQRKKLILLLIQFFVGFFALFYAIAMVENLLQYKEQVEKVAPSGVIQLISYEEYEQNRQAEIIENYQKCMKELQKKEYIKSVGTFENRYFYLTGCGEEVVNGMAMPTDILALTEFDCTKGGVEELLSYDGEVVIPVLVTEELEVLYPLGSEITAEEIGVPEAEEPLVCKVVGVVSSEMRYWNGNMIPIADSIRKCEGKYFIFPCMNPMKGLEAYQYNTLVIPSGESLDDGMKEDICQLYEEYGLIVEGNSLGEQVEEFYQGQKSFVLTIGGFAVILLMLSVLGCVGTLLASIMQRKEEFGIYITLGFTKRMLLKLVMGEILLLFLSAFLLAVAGSSCLLSSIETVTNVGMNIRILMVGVAVMSVCVVCSSLLPLRKVNSLQPIELMEGRE